MVLEDKRRFNGKEMQRGKGKEIGEVEEKYSEGNLTHKEELV